jgi:hypothetical protein
MRDPDDVLDDNGNLVRPGWHVRYMAQDPMPQDYADIFDNLGCPPGCTSPFCDCPGTD